MSYTYWYIMTHLHRERYFFWWYCSIALFSISKADYTNMCSCLMLLQDQLLLYWYTLWEDLGFFMVILCRDLPKLNIYLQLCKDMGIFFVLPDLHSSVLNFFFSVVSNFSVLNSFSLNWLKISAWVTNKNLSCIKTAVFNLNLRRSRHDLLKTPWQTLCINMRQFLEDWFYSFLSYPQCFMALQTVKNYYHKEA